MSVYSAVCIRDMDHEKRAYQKMKCAHGKKWKTSAGRSGGTYKK